MSVKHTKKRFAAFSTTIENVSVNCRYDFNHNSSIHPKKMLVNGTLERQVDGETTDTLEIAIV